MRNKKVGIKEKEERIKEEKEERRKEEKRKRRKGEGRRELGRRRIVNIITTKSYQYSSIKGGFLDRFRFYGEKA